MFTVSSFFYSISVAIRYSTVAICILPRVNTMRDTYSPRPTASSQTTSRKAENLRHLDL